MAIRRWEQEEDEHHQNPFLSISSSKASSSKLQFRKEVSMAQWDEKMGMGEVIEKKGSIWTTTGIIRNGKLYCHIEEILFLAERGALHIILSHNNSLSIGDLYKKIAEGKYGCSWEKFEAYRHLKSLGYIIGRHGIPWTMKDNRKFDSSSSQTTSSPNKTLNLDVEYGLSISLKGLLIDELKPTFDVYLPNSKFRKSSPGDPSFLLCILKVNPPSRGEVESIERSSSGISIKFCSVDHGQALESFTWVDHHACLKDEFLSLQRKLREAERSYYELRKKQERDSSRYRQSESDLHTEVERLRVESQSRKTLAENALGNIARLESDVSRLSSEEHISALKSSGISEYKTSVQFLQDCEAAREEAREEVWSLEVDPELEEVRKGAFLKGVSKALRMIARKRQSDVAGLGVEDLSEDECVVEEDE